MSKRRSSDIQIDYRIYDQIGDIFVDFIEQDFPNKDDRFNPKQSIDFNHFAEAYLKSNDQSCVMVIADALLNLHYRTYGKVDLVNDYIETGPNCNFVDYALK